MKKNETKLINLRIPLDLLNKLDIEAKANYSSRSKMIIDIIREHYYVDMKYR
mgnify:CR=1 FL=1